jgi:hypothetical protein
MTEMDEKVARLPAWARDHIRNLATRNEPMAEECARSRAKVVHLEKQLRKRELQIEAMVEMFRCAAKGGNEVANAVKSIVEDFLVSDEE